MFDLKLNGLEISILSMFGVPKVLKGLLFQTDICNYVLNYGWKFLVCFVLLRRISITDCLCVVVYVSVNGCVKYGGYSNNSIFRRQCHLYLDF